MGDALCPCLTVEQLETYDTIGTTVNIDADNNNDNVVIFNGTEMTTGVVVELNDTAFPRYGVGCASHDIDNAACQLQEQCWSQIPMPKDCLVKEQTIILASDYANKSDKENKIIRQHKDSIWTPKKNNVIDDNIHTLVSQSPTETVPILIGVISFATALALSTATQLKILGISTGTRPLLIPSTLGAASVCLASIASHQAAIAAHGYMQEFRAKKQIRSQSILEQLPDEMRRRCAMDIRIAGSNQSASSISHARTDWYRKEHVSLGGVVQVPMQTIRICVVGMIAFKLLGGRFWAVAPSSFTNIGSFARGGIPATENYATAAQRSTLERMGSIFGCHTCGSHRFLSSPLSRKAKFVGDHMPPKSVALQANARWYNRLLNRQVNFRFYPQCLKCSNKQGSMLSAAVQKQTKRNLAQAGGGSNAHFHGLRPRLHHLTGGVLSGITVVGASDGDIRKGNPRRYRALQRRIEDPIRMLLFGSSRR